MNMLLQSKGFEFSNLNWNNAIAKLKQLVYTVYDYIPIPISQLPNVSLLCEWHVNACWGTI